MPGDFLLDPSAPRTSVWTLAMDPALDCQILDTSWHSVPAPWGWSVSCDGELVRWWPVYCHCAISLLSCTFGPYGAFPWTRYLRAPSLCCVVLRVPQLEPLSLSVCFVFTVNLFCLQPTQGSCTWGSKALFLALFICEGGRLPDRPEGVGWRGDGGGGWVKEGAARTQSHWKAEHS